MATGNGIPSGIPDPGLRPQASPVDTFHTTDAGVQLGQLANALKQFDPTLEALQGTVFQKSAQTGLQEGEQRARELSEQRETLASATKKGLIQAGRNPFFIVGVHEQFGKIAAGNYASYLKSAMAQNPQLQSTTNPDDFNKFEAATRQKYMSEQLGDDNSLRDIHFERGFSLIDSVVQDQRNEWTNQLSKRIEGYAFQNVYTLHAQALDDHFDKDPPEQLAAMLNATNDAVLKDNPGAGNIINQRTVEALTQYAELHPDDLHIQDKITALAKLIKGGSGSLYGTQQFRTAFVESEKNIRQQRELVYKNWDHQEEETKKKAVQGAWSNLFDAANDFEKQHGSLQGFDTTKFAADMETATGTGEGRDLVQRYIANRIAPKDNDGTAYTHALAQIYGADPTAPGKTLTRDSLFRLAASPDNPFTPTQVNELVSHLTEKERTDIQRGTLNLTKTFNNPIYDGIERSIGTAFHADFGMKEFDNPEVLARKGAFQTDLRARYLDAVKKDPSIAQDPQRLQSLALETFIQHAAPNEQGPVLKSLGVPGIPKAGVSSPEQLHSLLEGKPVVRRYDDTAWRGIKTDLSAFFKRGVKLPATTARVLYENRVPLTVDAVTKFEQDQDKLPSPLTGY